MPKSKPLYPSEFRAEAMRLAWTGSKPHAEMTCEFGMTTKTLCQWLQ
jgi:hypothetical protein